MWLLTPYYHATHIISTPRLPSQDSATWSLWRIHETEKAGQQGREVLDAILSSDAVPAAVQMLTRGSYYGRHGAAGLLGSIAERGKDVQVWEGGV